MSMDRATKVVLTALAVGVALIAVNLWVISPPGNRPLGAAPAEAQGQAPQFQVAIPKAWGKVIGYSPGNVLLEAPDGSLREVDIRGDYPKVKVHATWN